MSFRSPLIPTISAARDTIGPNKKRNDQLHRQIITKVTTSALYFVMKDREYQQLMEKNSDKGEILNLYSRALDYIALPQKRDKVETIGRDFNYFAKS